MTSISRRQFIFYSLVGLGALATGKFFFGKSKKEIPLQILGPNAQAGHRLRWGDFPEPSEIRQVKTLIVGSGIAGLSAAWWLKRNAYEDFTLLELEDYVGGNAHSGQNQISAYPWGAHYVPTPGSEAIYVRELFEELGLIETYDQNGEPRYSPYVLCADPNERLFLHGQWQEGLLPQLGASAQDKKEYERFFRWVDELRLARGKDGKKLFAIPIAYSSQDPEWIELDQISFAEYLKQQGYQSTLLLWYLDYACRDDYGCKLDQSSAWAGLHYFAARSKEASVLTWPEGNAWIAKRLSEKFPEKILKGQLVFELEEKENLIWAKSWDSKNNCSILWKADQIIYAGPQFTFSKVFLAYRNHKPEAIENFSYAPWMVANLSLKKMPEGRGTPLAWDNVFYQSKSLGYVVATHQSLDSHPHQTVLTFYYPLCEKSVEEERQNAFARGPEEWKKLILDDFLKVHPELETEIEDIQVWVWGHAMIRPKPGFIWGKERQSIKAIHNKIFFAHSDLSGISIFEEAQYWGVEAAKQVLKKV
ncbi:MAG: NAD(P)-binding protein [Deltaproteobacteria bacterium]|nr:NAD(P)-binding protein [Deltaproteobacteria bacterium]